jgi:hypothetical protein
MSKMIELVEQMRARLEEITSTEHDLVRALAEALSRVDQKLLQDVRNMSTEHDSRRGSILNELEGLASRLGAFPAVRQVAPGLPFADAAATTITHANGNHPSYGGADWRQAASNIEDELDLFCKARVASN